MRTNVKFILFNSNSEIIYLLDNYFLYVIHIYLTKFGNNSGQNLKKEDYIFNLKVVSSIIITPHNYYFLSNFYVLKRYINYGLCI